MARWSTPTVPGEVQAFLDAELRRAELPALGVQIVEIALVGSLLPETRKPPSPPPTSWASSTAAGPAACRGRAERSSRVARSRPPRGEPARLEPDRSARAIGYDATAAVHRRVASDCPSRPRHLHLFEDEAAGALRRESGQPASAARRVRRRQPSLHRRLEGLAVRTAAVTTIPACFRPRSHAPGGAPDPRAPAAFNVVRRRASHDDRASRARRAVAERAPGRGDRA